MTYQRLDPYREPAATGCDDRCLSCYPRRSILARLLRMLHRDRKVSG